MGVRSRSVGLAAKTATLVGIATGLTTAAVWLIMGGRTSSGLLALVAGLAAGMVTFVAIRILVNRRVGEALELASTIRRLGPPGNVDATPSRLELEDLTSELEAASASVSARIAGLRKIENYRQEFLGDVSHELQTPIFAVQGFAETLLDGALEDPLVNRSFVEKIHRNASRLSALVNDLSDISQIETGSLRMNLAPFDPNQLTRETVEALEMSAEQSGVSVHVFVGQHVGLVTGDKERIRQVLSNLLTNGIKYNNRGGSVELAIWQSSETDITFSVTDDGIGMTADDVTRATERFFRVDKSRSRESGGTGLGLAIVKHIIEAHGSTLQIRSTLGHGSTVDFSLPAASKDLPQTDPLDTP